MTGQAGCSWCAAVGVYCGHRKECLQSNLALPGAHISKCRRAITNDKYCGLAKFVTMAREWPENGALLLPCCHASSSLLRAAGLGQVYYHAMVKLTALLTVLWQGSSPG